jgi:hypothetical protein
MGPAEQQRGHRRGEPAGRVGRRVGVVVHDHRDRPVAGARRIDEPAARPAAYGASWPACRAARARRGGPMGSSTCAASAGAPAFGGRGPPALDPREGRGRGLSGRGAADGAVVPTRPRPPDRPRRAGREPDLGVVTVGARDRSRSTARHDGLGGRDIVRELRIHQQTRTGSGSNRRARPAVDNAAPHRPAHVRPPARPPERTNAWRGASGSRWRPEQDLNRLTGTRAAARVGDRLLPCAAA